jgi:hypothetical protein
MFVIDSVVPTERQSAVSFIRKKKRNGTEYCYLVANSRVDGKIRQRVICYLGQHKSVKAAHDYWIEQSKMTGRKRHASQMLKKLAPYLEQ